MGRDTGLPDFGGDPLIVHTARPLQPLDAEVTVVGSPSRYAKFGLHAIADEPKAQRGPDRAGFGPLAGIATALAATQSRWNLIVACYLPYPSAASVHPPLSPPLPSPREAV